MVQDATLSYKNAHLLVYITGTKSHLSVRGDLWPYKIQQIRLRPRTPLGSSRRSPDPLIGWGGGHPLPNPTLRRLDPRAFGARLCSDKFCLKNALIYIVYL